MINILFALLLSNVPPPLFPDAESFAGGSLTDLLAFHSCTQTHDDTTPNVGAPGAGCNVLITSIGNLAGTNITNLLNAVPNQEIIVVGMGGGAWPTTIFNGGSFTLERDWTGAANAILFLHTVGAGVFVEIGRRTDTRLFNTIYTQQLTSLAGDVNVYLSPGIFGTEYVNPGAVGLEMRCAQSSVSPAIGDVLCYHEDMGKDSLGNWTVYNTINSQIVSPTDGTEQSKMTFRVMEAGTLSDILTLDGTTGAKQVYTNEKLYAMGLDAQDQDLTNVGAGYFDSIKSDGTNISIEADGGAGLVAVGDGTYSPSHAPNFYVEGIGEINGQLYCDSTINLATGTKITDGATNGTLQVTDSTPTLGFRVWQAQANMFNIGNKDGTSPVYFQWGPNVAGNLQMSWANPTVAIASGGGGTANLTVGSGTLTGATLNLTSNLNYSSNTLVSIAPQTSNALPFTANWSGSDSYAKATTAANQIGGNIFVAAGIGSAYTTVTSYTTSTNDTLDFYVIDATGTLTKTTKTADGVSWPLCSATSNAACALALKNSTTVPGVTMSCTDGSCSDAKVFVTPDVGTQALWLLPTEGGGAPVYGTVTQGAGGRFTVVDTNPNGWSGSGAPVIDIISPMGQHTGLFTINNTAATTYNAGILFCPASACGTPGIVSATTIATTGNYAGIGALYGSLLNVGSSLAASNYGQIDSAGIHSSVTIAATASGTDTNAITATGNGTGYGISATGGTTGSGGYFSGGATSGRGITVVGTGDKTAVYATGGLGGTGGYGVLGIGGVAASGGKFTGGATGAGIDATSGATSGPGCSCSTGNVVTGPFHMNTMAADPTTCVIGDYYTTTAGVLKSCTVAGSPGTWTTVGVQSP